MNTLEAIWLPDWSIVLHRLVRWMNIVTKGWALKASEKITIVYYRFPLCLIKICKEVPLWKRNLRKRDLFPTVQIVGHWTAIKYIPPSLGICWLDYWGLNEWWGKQTVKISEAGPILTMNRAYSMMNSWTKSKYTMFCSLLINQIHFRFHGRKLCCPLQLRVWLHAIHQEMKNTVKKCLKDFMLLSLLCPNKLYMFYPCWQGLPLFVKCSRISVIHWCTRLARFYNNVWIAQLMQRRASSAVVAVQVGLAKIKTSDAAIQARSRSWKTFYFSWQTR